MAAGFEDAVDNVYDMLQWRASIDADFERLRALRLMAVQQGTPLSPEEDDSLTRDEDRLQQMINARPQQINHMLATAAAVLGVRPPAGLAQDCADLLNLSGGLAGALQVTWAQVRGACGSGLTRLRCPALLVQRSSGGGRGAARGAVAR